MPLPEPFRGEVWDVDFPDFGVHPAIVISANSLNARLGHVAVIPVTGTAGPALTHIPLTPDAGLTRYDQSYADVTARRVRAAGTYPPVALTTVQIDPGGCPTAREISLNDLPSAHIDHSSSRR